MLNCYQLYKDPVRLTYLDTVRSVMHFLILSLIRIKRNARHHTKIIG